MSTTGAKAPGSGANASGVGSVDWTKSSAITADDSFSATVDGAGSSFTTHWLVATGYDFSSLADSDIIDGITVIVDVFSASGSAASDSNANIWQSGAAGTNQATSTTLASGTPITYGSSSNTWGLSLTGADVKAAGFGFGFVVACGSRSHISIDFISMELTYHAGSVTVTKDVTASATLAKQATKDVTGSGRLLQQATKSITASAKLTRFPVANVTAAGRFSIPHTKDVTASAKLSQAATKSITASAKLFGNGHKDVAASATMTTLPGSNLVASGRISHGALTSLTTAGRLSQGAVRSVTVGAVLGFVATADVDAGAVIRSGFSPIIPTVAVARLSGRVAPAIGRMKRPGG